MWSSIMQAARIIAIGLTIGGSSFSYFGAEPCVGSKTATSSPMLALAREAQPADQPGEAVGDDVAEHVAGTR